LLRLPKDVKDHPRLAELEGAFTADMRVLREGGVVQASHWPLDGAVRRALKAALNMGHLTQGLEAIARVLDREQKGLAALAAKSGAPQAPRLSRLLILANDGTERFYHDVESLLRRNADRTWAVVVAADAEQLGAAATQKGGIAKALLIDERRALGLFLSTLAEGLPLGST
jgi:hypothetical protein